VGNGPTTSRPGAVNTLIRKYIQFGLAIRNRQNDLSGRGLRLGLGFHGLADAETFEHPKNLGTSRARRYSRNRLRFEQRLLERVRRAYLRFGSARTDGDALADASDVGRGPRNKLSLGGGILEHFPRDDSKIERPAGRDQLDQFRSGTETHDKLMASGGLNCAPSSLMRAVIAPPAKTWSSAGRALAIGDDTNAAQSTVATVSECFCMKDTLLIAALYRKFGLSILST